MKSFGLPAVESADARVLILGTLPGAVSLTKRQYYAQPGNAFWSIMAEIVGAELSSPYEERVRRLIERRFAMWDVCASAIRSGSLDSAIRRSSIRPNDFVSFFASHPHIQRICFNGSKAGTLFERLVLPNVDGHLADVRRVTLPSSSPAYASMPLRQKIQFWKAALTDNEA